MSEKYIKNEDIELPSELPEEDGGDKEESVPPEDQLASSLEDSAGNSLSENPTHQDKNVMREIGTNIEDSIAKGAELKLAPEEAGENDDENEHDPYNSDVGAKAA